MLVLATVLILLRCGEIRTSRHHTERYRKHSGNTMDRSMCSSLKLSIGKLRLHPSSDLDVGIFAVRSHVNE